MYRRHSFFDIPPYKKQIMGAFLQSCSLLSRYASNPSASEPADSEPPAPDYPKECTNETGTQSVAYQTEQYPKAPEYCERSLVDSRRNEKNIVATRKHSEHLLEITSELEATNSLLSEMHEWFEENERLRDHAFPNAAD